MIPKSDLKHCLALDYAAEVTMDGEGGDHAIVDEGIEAPVSRSVSTGGVILNAVY